MRKRLLNPFAMFILGWTLFALCAPVLAYVAWMTKQKGILPKIISMGIVGVAVPGISCILALNSYQE